MKHFNLEDNYDGIDYNDYLFEEALAKLEKENEKTNI